MSDEPSLTVSQVAERLSISPESVRALINRGQLKAFLVSQPKKRRVYRVEKQWLQDFIESSLPAKRSWVPLPKPVGLSCKKKYLRTF